VANKTEVHHPIFARLYERLAKLEDKKGAVSYRGEMLEGLSGRVIEVGAGTGSNFKHYPATVDEVVAVEPEEYLRGKAKEAAASAPVKVTVVEGLADALPGADAEFDAGIASLVLCSVHDQASALGELRRVIKPGGELRFYEHVVSTEPRTAQAQKLANPLYTRLSGGCNLQRDTGAAIEAAGFTVLRSRRFRFPEGRIGLPHILGTARRN
jgi:ubiquinone/menaquinone biosynthesis C-methylase UbiE